MPSFYDATGAIQQVAIDPSIYRQAADVRMSVRQLINRSYDVGANAPAAFDQFLASEGIYLTANREYGISPTLMSDIIDGRPEMKNGTIVRDSNPASRILFPAIVLSAIEDKLAVDLTSDVQAFGSMVAVDDAINSDKYERPVLDFSRPEAARSGPVAQLAEPKSMLTITASDKSQSIVGSSIGMEISDQALKSTTLPLVSLAMTRQALVEGNEKVNGYILGFLNGDSDWNMVALSAVANAVDTVNALDATLTNGAGVLSEKAWMKWLTKGFVKRTITHVICDFDTAMAIQNRTGRPTVQTDNATSKRIDTIETVLNPNWTDKVKVFITDDPAFPTNTILGFDKRYGIHRVTSTSLNYQAAEQYAMRRSSKFRVDSGQIAYRLFDEAWAALTL